jgi:hypothetical protein
MFEFLSFNEFLSTFGGDGSLNMKYHPIIRNRSITILVFSLGKVFDIAARPKKDRQTTISSCWKHIELLVRYCRPLRASYCSYLEAARDGAQVSKILNLAMGKPTHPSKSGSLTLPTMLGCMLWVYELGKKPQTTTISGEA